MLTTGGTYLEGMVGPYTKGTMSPMLHVYVLWVVQRSSSTKPLCAAAAKELFLMTGTSEIA
jgi:hypothetical protein